MGAYLFECMARHCGRVVNEMAETRLALVEPGHVSWAKLIELMTVAPARIAKLNKGTLAVGADADVTIIDPDLT